MAFHLTKKNRIIFTISISFAFFLTEISIGFYTRSLAVVADAFHYLNDLIGFIVALAALIVSERKDSPRKLSFGWQRSQLLGAFFNGVFLLALGVSIFLQAIERFIALERVENPKLVLVAGSVGLALNILSAAILHDHGGKQQLRDLSETYEGTGRASAHAEHRHTTTSPRRPGRDLGMLGVFIHVVGDAINNIGVIIAALVIWLAKYDGRFYADPGVSVGIAILIFISAVPLVKSSGSVLLQGAPSGVDLEDVKHDLEQISGVSSIHELHIWQLSQQKSIATAHVATVEQSIAGFMQRARTITECLHSYGVHSVTLQPELVAAPAGDSQVAIGDGEARSGDTDASANAASSGTVRQRIADPANCQITCGDVCEDLSCCS